MARPLPIDYSFCFLIEASGDDAHRVHADLEKLLDTAMRANMILDATLSMSNASAEAIWRIRDCSLELARSFLYAARFALDVSIDINQMDHYVKTIVERIKEIDPGAFAIVFGHAGDGNLHIELHSEHTPDKRQELERLAY